jgi:hypothetical protein
MSIYSRREIIREDAPCKPVDIVAVLVQPSRVEFGDGSGDGKEVAVVEVMVVVVAVSEVDPEAGRALFVHDASPCRLVRSLRASNRVILKPIPDRRLQVLDHGRDEVWSVETVRDESEARLAVYGSAPEVELCVT